MNFARRSPLDNFGFGELTDEDYGYFQRTIFELSGISLGDTKKELVKSRLTSHIKSLGLHSFTDYRNYLSRLSSVDPEWQRFINFLTTNKTDFFREAQHFEYLKNVVIPKWLEKNQKELKVWCCASSTGQEPYTLAMVLSRALPPHISYTILATDIDTEVLQEANNGVYHINKLPEIPSQYRDEFINIGKGEVQGWFRVSSKIRERIIYKQHNLISSAFPGNEVFDLIFCRNVLIYFSAETIKPLIKKFHPCLKENGLLFISHSESISKLSDKFNLVHPSVYQKVGAND